jgi:hypothetical protein
MNDTSNDWPAYFYSFITSPSIGDNRNFSRPKKYVEDFVPAKIIFNDRTTVVYWKDGSSTLSSVSEGEPFNNEVGVAMCIAKKVFKNNRSEFLRVVANGYRQPKKIKKLKDTEQTE